MKEVFFSKVVEPGPIELDEEESHHVRVKRIKRGEEIILTDGKGKIGYGRLERIEKRAVISVFRIEKEENKPSRIGVGIPLLKGNSMDEAIRNAVEFGADIIYPYISSRTVVKMVEPEEKLLRWKRIAISSCKVARRFFFPSVEEILPFDKIISLHGWDARMLLYEEEKERRLGSVENLLRQNILVVLGPEGGFTKEEVEKAVKRGFITVSLGKRIFRSASVPSYILSIISFVRNEA